MCLVFISSNIYGDLSIYLNPRINYSGKIKVKSLGLIEGSSITKELLETYVPESLYKDGFIDQSEIRFFLKKLSGVVPVVYGTATRIIENKKTEDIAIERKIIVKKNDSIVLVMRRGRIKIEFTGKAMKSSYKNQIIPVKIRNNKIIKVKIISSSRGEILQ